MKQTFRVAGGSFLMESANQSELCFPQLANLSCKRSSSSLSAVEPLMVLVASICILTVLLNLLVVVAISHFRQLHTPTNLILLSLAVTDILVGLLTIPAMIYSSTSCWFSGDFLCYLFILMLILVTSASVGNMVLISADRYVAICKPLHYNVKITWKRIQVCVSLCWFLPLLYCCIILNDQLVHPGKLNSCYGECVIRIEFTGMIFDVLLTFALPLSIIVTLYTRVFVVAVSQARAMRSQVTGCKVRRDLASFRAKKSELKAARSLGILVLVFLLCFSPYYVSSFIEGDTLLSQFKQIFLHLYSFNSCANPIIYALFYPWFRKAVRLIVTLQIFRPGSRETKVS